jgi:hypothetical protein
MLATKLAEFGYFFSFTKYPDEWEREQLKRQEWVFKPRRNPPVEVAV